MQQKTDWILLRRQHRDRLWRLRRLSPQKLAQHWEATGQVPLFTSWEEWIGYGEEEAWEYLNYARSTRIALLLARSAEEDVLLRSWLGPSTQAGEPVQTGLTSENASDPT